MFPFILIVATIFSIYLLWEKWRSYRAERKAGSGPPSPSPASRSPVTSARSSQSFARDSIPISRTRGPAPLRWIPFGSGITAAGFNLQRGGVYVSETGSAAHAQPGDPSEIILRLAVRESVDEPALNYWPSYAGLTAGQRGRYLRWLSSDRRSLPEEDGYLFLYYYGLERRALVDRADLPDVCREVFRLRQVHLAAGAERKRSFRSYSASLLWYLAAKSPESFPPEVAKGLLEEASSLTGENTGAVLAWLAATRGKLAAREAFLIAAGLPASQQSVVTKRVDQEFRRLFTTRFAAQYPSEFLLQLPKTKSSCLYRPASAGLQPCRFTTLTPAGLSSQFAPLAELWNGCIADLRGLSRSTGDAPGGELSVEQWEALPGELRQGSDHPLTRAVCGIVAAHAQGGAECVIEIGRLAQVVGLPQRDRLTPSQSKRIAQVFDDVGYAVEPDARLVNQGYGWDEPVAVFLKVDDAEENAGKYRGAAWALRLGMAIAWADGTVTDDETRTLTAGVHSAFDLGDADRRRLEALRSLLLRSAADLSGVGKRVQDSMPLKARQALGVLLVAIAAADGVVHVKEVAALRKCYRILGLSPDELDAALGKVAPGSAEGLVTVAVPPPQPGRAGEAIPPPPVAVTGTLQLDPVAVRRLLAETEQVRRILAEAMSAPDGTTEDESDSPPLVDTPAMATPPVATDTVKLAVTSNEGPTPEAGESAPAQDSRGQADLPALPERFRGFCREIQGRDVWPLPEATALARRHGLMLSGAVEAINDAAVESLGRAILYEEGDELKVERALSAEAPAE